jgi:error-prone DNA polymerase
MLTPYAELQVTTNYGFLEGASHPDELVAQAAALGYRAIGVADRNTLAGVVRAHVAATQHGIRLVVGARLDFRDRPGLLCFPTDRAAYGRLATLLTLGRRRAPKGQCWLDAADLPPLAEGQILVALPPEGPDPGFLDQLRRDRAAFGPDLHLAAQHLYRGDDAARLDWLAGMAAAAGVRLVATNDVLYHVPARRPLQDVVSCIRLGLKIDGAGPQLLAHAERHLKPPEEMARLFRRYGGALDATVEIAERCRFSLDELRYDYPGETPDGRSPQAELAHRVEEALVGRYGPTPPAKVAGLVAHELALIGELGYAAYFLTVDDIVRFAKGRGILCQGRGSAANSAICWVLGITAVDPEKSDLLFERFVSKARNEPPDIDVDFGHERREEVIQFIYEKYGRARAGLAATVICYRMRSALREVGKVMGLSEDAVAALAGSVWGWSRQALKESQVREAGLDPEDARLGQVLDLAGELVGFPRHLSQHVGGFVITAGPLHELVPIANAAMADRTTIEWDKDDLDALKILKVDILALGMLTCIDKAFALIAARHGRQLTLDTVPGEVPGVYEMISRADTVGVFQIESRAQMSMLPRLQPRTFYDLVIEVAIVRPGPIQGDMVHPYLRRRQGQEPVAYPSAALERVLKKTLGVPLFQEQAMNIAIVAAGFTPHEADELRRAMATFKRVDKVRFFEDRLIEGMVARGYDRDFATRCFKQIEGFGSYGFPESHAASFAILVYVSAWIKWRYPAIFACALLNSQPMGFYAPAQIVRDAREHGVEIRPIDINHSDWDCTLEGDALRLGFRQIRGLAEAEARALVAHRGDGYGSPAALSRRVRRPTLEALARADAFRSLGLDRRRALWAVMGLETEPLPLFRGLEAPPEPAIALPDMALGEHVVEDYGATGLSLKRHPLAFLRESLAARGIIPCAGLGQTRDGRRREVAGLVLVRQRPGTAKGVVFMTIEDETGIANLVVWAREFERFRRIVMGARCLAARGIVQKEGLVIHVIVERLVDLTADVHGIAVPFARADEVIRPGQDAREMNLPSRDFH